MKRIVSVLMVLVLLFAFVACNSEAGGQSGGGSGEMSPAEQAILNKYGEDISWLLYVGLKFNFLAGNQMVTFNCGTRGF